METNNSDDYREWVSRCKEARDSGVPQHPMVGWYDLRKLAQTAVNIVISSALGTRSDVRWMEAATGEGGIIEYDEFCKDGNFWFDYMADTGDGWNSTCRMAYLVGKPELSLKHDNKVCKLPRGKFLILGGDEVYPSASKQGYRERLVNPFVTAHPQPPEGTKCGKPDLYAIPGNHDWYDGLVSFMRQFHQNRNIGIWRTKQSRSYFALKLPCNWWIWGVDTQLEADIDWPQVQFFISAAKKMREDGPSNLIICTAEPYWIYANLYEEKEKQRQLYNNLLFLLGEKVVGSTNEVNLYLSIAGDLHHYRRHEDECDKNRHRIVAGGGGSFLHPTHDCELVERILVDETSRQRQTLPPDTAAGSLGEGTDYSRQCAKITDRQKLGRDKCGPLASSDPECEQPFEHIYRLAAQFPDEKTSRGLSLGDLIFIWHNPQFGVVTAVVYSLIAALMLDFGYTNEVPGVGPHISFLWLSIVLAAHVGVYYYFCDDRRGWRFRFMWGGLVHGGIQFAVACWIVSLWSVPAVSANFFWRWIYLFVGVPISGYIVGSTLLGLYLLVSLNFWKINQNEAFSALRIEGYKNFLRLCIGKDGSLTIYPIGLRSLHDDPFLIEAPIRIIPQTGEKDCPGERDSTEVNSGTEEDQEQLNPSGSAWRCVGVKEWPTDA